MKKIHFLAATFVIFSFLAFSQTRNTRSYNGMRVPADHSPFQVVCIESNSSKILVTFNIQINQSSFTKENILFNEKALSPSDEIRFTKNGKAVEIKKKLSVGSKFSLEFRNVKSFDDEELKTSVFDSLLPWTTSEYKVLKANNMEISL